MSTDGARTFRSEPLPIRRQQFLRNAQNLPLVRSGGVCRKWATSPTCSPGAGRGKKVSTSIPLFVVRRQPIFEHCSKFAAGGGSGRRRGLPRRVTPAASFCERRGGRPQAATWSSARWFPAREVGVETHHLAGNGAPAVRFNRPEPQENRLAVLLLKDGPLAGSSLGWHSRPGQSRGAPANGHRPRQEVRPEARAVTAG
jgi:hypothetical protein